jgi:hypothetical protein
MLVHKADNFAAICVPIVTIPGTIPLHASILAFSQPHEPYELEFTVRDV